METKSYQIEHVNLHINSYDDIRKKEKNIYTKYNPDEDP